MNRLTDESHETDRPTQIETRTYMYMYLVGGPTGSSTPEVSYAYLSLTIKIYCIKMRKVHWNLITKSQEIALGFAIRETDRDTQIERQV